MIFVGLADAAGFLRRLADGLEREGKSVWYVNLSADRFRYEHTRSPFAVFETRALAYPTGSLGRRLWLPAVALSRAVLFAIAVVKCDTFILSGYPNGGFFRFLELPVLRWAGKQVVVIFLGSDCRPPYLSGRHLDDQDGRFDARVKARETAEMAKRVRWIERHACLVVNHAGTAQFMTRPFMKFLALGIPYELAAPRGETTSAIGRPLRVLHAPSRPLAKGTPQVRQSIERLRARGVQVDYVELTGMPNSRVLEAIEEADLVVDELYSDMPLATFATEAAAFGKPTITTGYYAPHLARDHVGVDLPPAEFVHPEQLDETLWALAQDAELRRSIGTRLAEWLAVHWAPRAVAGRLLLALEGRAPRAWWMAPEDADYIGGWGLSEQAWRATVGEYLATCGQDSLWLDRKRLAERIMARLASGL